VERVMMVRASIIIVSYYVAGVPILQRGQIQIGPHVPRPPLSSFSSNPSNLDSYEPNLYICEYLANRCQQSALNTLKKLNDLIARKYKREANRADPQTENIIKLNIAVLMILQGRRDNALVLLREIYHNRNCFIEFMQTRIFLLLL
jgi:hypothetical protein